MVLLSALNLQPISILPQFYHYKIYFSLSLPSLSQFHRLPVFLLLHNLSDLLVNFGCRFSVNVWRWNIQNSMPWSQILARLFPILHGLFLFFARLAHIIGKSQKELLQVCHSQNLLACNNAKCILVERNEAWLKLMLNTCPSQRIATLSVLFFKLSSGWKNIGRFFRGNPAWQAHLARDWLSFPIWLSGRERFSKHKTFTPSSHVDSY